MATTPTSSTIIRELVKWFREEGVNFLSPTYPTPVGWQWHQDHKSNEFYLIYMMQDPKDNIIINRQYMKQFDSVADDMTNCGDTLPITLDNDRLLVKGECPDGVPEISLYMADVPPAGHSDWVMSIRKGRPFAVVTGETSSVVGFIRELSRSLPLAGGKAAPTSPAAIFLLDQIIEMANSIVKGRCTNGLTYFDMDDYSRYLSAVKLLKTVSTLVDVMLQEGRNGNKLQEGVRPQDIGGQED